MKVLTRREADMFACLTDALVIADPPFVPVLQTRVVELLDGSLAAGPPAVRDSFRSIVYLIELLPLFTHRRRFRQLTREQRIEFLSALSKGRLATATKPIRAFLTMIYYSDDAVMATQGFDREALIKRGKELRKKEGRW